MLMILLILASIGMGVFLHCKYPAWNPKNKDKKQHPKWFYAWIIGVAVLGGTWAFFLPIAINSGFSKDDDGAALRQALIYTTGGILGVITLGETHRKNTFEKTKNDQDHTRQVRAERRARYAKAIEQLADEKAPIRLGGIYTLVKLVDEWLADEKTLPNGEERREEGQVIINSLCAYIRSPFDLVPKAEVPSQDKTPENYEGGDQQFVKDQARFREEKELRLTILDAISTRLNGGIITQENETEKPMKGQWSSFDYDFSNAHFFYLTDFSDSFFSASSNFIQATFTQGADFSRATFTHDANFFGATFTQDANFIGATFTRANFFEATFKYEPIFVYTLGNKTYKARFSYKVNPKNYNFYVSPKSCKIETEEQEYNGVKFRIPKGAILFDPDEPSEQKDDNDS